MHRPISIVLLLILLLTACGPPLPERLRVELPEPPVVSSENVVCVPGDRFQALEDKALWRMQSTGQLLCSIARVPEGPLSFRLAPTGFTHKYRFTVSWDDAPLLAEPVSTHHGMIEVVVPEERLQSGVHRLRFQRVYEAVDGPVGNFHDNDFSELSYRVEDRVFTLRVADAADLHYAGRLLERGVTGLDLERWSGFLFDGPRDGKSHVVSPTAGLLEWGVENASNAEATFWVALSETRRNVTVPSRERGQLAIPVPAGRSELRLSVTVDESSPGAADGWFLWSQPALQPGRTVSLEWPPIFLLTLDTTRRDALSPYGESPEVTPEIEAFADQATIFERAYSTTSWTLPAHVSMMTGLYPSRHRAGVSHTRLPETSLTVAGLLGRGGYRTAGFPGSRVCSSLYGISRGFDVFLDPESHQVRGDELTDRLIEFLDQNADMPLFVFANYFDPHILYRAPEEYQERLGVPSLAWAIEGQPIWQQLAQENVQAWDAIVAGRAPGNPDILRWLRASYLAEVAFMDAQIGRFFDALREHGLYDRSMIVLVADHGELLGEGGHFSHSARLDPELVEVPLLIKWPGQKESRRVEDLVSITDLFPTLLAAGGVEAPPRDGRLLTPEGVLEGEESRPRVFSEEHESVVHPLFASQKVADHLYGLHGLRSHRVVWPEGQSCLGRDNGAWRNVDCPPDGERLFRQVRNLLGTESSTAQSPAGAALTPEEREALEALGYL